jgi:hypothetical protein
MPTDAQVYAAFMKHVKKLEAMAVNGDKDAVRSLACMALLAEGWRPGGPDGDGGKDADCDNFNVIDFTKYKLAA